MRPDLFAQVDPHAVRSPADPARLAAVDQEAHLAHLQMLDLYLRNDLAQRRLERRRRQKPG